MKTLEERFWSKVDKSSPTGCWLWTARKNKGGYGTINSKAKSLLTHRVSYAERNGPIPPGLCVLHRCDVRACVNPTHLFLGTYADNAQDMVRKGRSPYRKGEKNGRSKLCGSDVVSVRNLYKTGKYTQKSIAEIFDVSQVLIGLVISNKVWSHV